MVTDAKDLVPALLLLLVVIALLPMVVVVAMLYEVAVLLLPSVNIPKHGVLLQSPRSGILGLHILDLHPYQLGLLLPSVASCYPI